MADASEYQFILFHGTGANPESNWFPWIKRELRKRNLSVVTPKFPTPENQSLENWMSAFSEQVGEVSSKMIFIGHSMGVGMILRLLEKSEVPVEATFLVSGWDGLLSNSDFDPLIESFYKTPFDYSQIQLNLGHCRIYHGSNDPYVPLQMAEELSEKLAVEIKVIAGGGHLNAESGFTQFPLLLADINEMLGNTDLDLLLDF